MEPQQTVWLVTREEEDSTTIVAVCTTPERAQEIADRWPGAGVELMPRTLDEDMT